jgi:8-oxo-dGTP diphosphatase
VSFVFETNVWSGIVSPADPDGVVTDARFYPISEAIALLEHVPWRSMHEPLLAYLRGSHPAGTVWLYAEHGGAQKLLASLPEQAQG